MLRALPVAVLAVALCTIAAAAPATAERTDPDRPEIVAIYPNPVADGDAGEFVVLDLPAGTASSLALTDGETTVAIPNGTSGTVRLSTAANRTRALVGRPVRKLPGHLALANSGERVRLVSGNLTVDAVRYEDAPDGELLRVAADDGGGHATRWQPLGATDREVVTGGAGTVEAFVLPDAGGAPAGELANASDRILLAGYTLTSERVAATLRRAHRRNVTVRVLVEGGPVGGVSERQARLLDDLAAAGIDVRAVGGDRARYRFHHPKYAVVDDRAVVTTENWKPAGTGGRASRGWGVVTTQSAVVTGLVETFRADAGWRDAVPWEDYRSDVNATNGSVATGTYGGRFDTRAVPVNRTRLLVAPDNAEGAVVDLLRGADDSIWIEQAGVGGVNQPFVRESLAAARRGVTVRLLLGSEWYNREDNRAIADRLNAIADREGLDLDARLVDPNGRFEYLHAKGAVVDGEHVLLGSLNWNNNSARNNREVALVLTGEAVGDYYGGVVRADWRGGTTRIVVGLAAVAVLAAIVALLVARRIRFVETAR